MHYPALPLRHASHRRVAKALSMLCLSAATTLAVPRPQVESLDRGLIGLVQQDGLVFLSWRLLADDAPEVAFNIYRITAPTNATIDYGKFSSTRDITDGAIKLNAEPVSDVTWFIDSTPTLQRATSYFVRPVVKGRESAPSRPVQLAAGAEPRAYHRLPLQNPPGYEPLEGSVADLDGDGAYEIVVMQAARHLDNSRSGPTDPAILQAYRLDGTRLWEINLGPNIRGGAHYTQFMVYDFDGDGRAELACKTADGSVDGAGRIIGDASANHVNERGHILAGPEFLTLFDGLTGAALDTVPYWPLRHPTNPLNPSPDQMKEIWGDGNANRSERYLAGVAYLDGKRPSLVAARGYYTRSCLAAYDVVKGRLKPRWTFDSHDGNPANLAYAGQGNHSLSVADVDGDGGDEIIYGAAVIDHDGKGLHSTGWGHGDALHVSDIYWANPGLEILTIQERFDQQGISLRDGESGRSIFTIPSVKADEKGGDKGEGPGRGIAVNADPRFPGSEVWAIGAQMNGIWTADGTRIGDRPRNLPANFAVWWDGDLLRELLDQNFIAKWNWQTGLPDRLLTAHECISSNGTKATPFVSADLWGDWREEIVWRTRDGSALHIYTSPHPTAYRMITLMQDPQYRVAVAWQNVAYNQPPHPSFALDPSLTLPDRKPVKIVKPRCNQ